MIARFNRTNHARNLPDAYKKTPESNNAKLLVIEKSAVDYLRKATSDIYDSLDIDKATGVTLDLYGEMLQQDRGVATDEQYRALLKSRIVRNLSGSDHNSIVKALCITFDCDPSDILLSEIDGECAVTLEGIPFDALNRANIDANTAAAIVKTLIPAGVKFEALNFSGTFEFCATESEYDADKGFADIEQTIGGTLGFAADSGKALPV